MHPNQQNPYQSPASTDSAIHAMFRPKFIDSWFFWLLRGCDLHSVRATNSADLVLRGHLFWSATLWFVTLGGPTLSAVASLFNTHPQPDWRGPWFISAVCLIFGVTGLLARERIVLTQHSIEKAGPFMRTRSIAWNDVVSLVFTKHGAIRLVSNAGRWIQINPDLVGISGVMDVLESVLPRSVIEVCTENIRTYRRFIGAGRRRG